MVVEFKVKPKTTKRLPLKAKSVVKKHRYLTPKKRRRSFQKTSVIILTTFFAVFSLLSYLTVTTVSSLQSKMLSVYIDPGKYTNFEIASNILDRNGNLLYRIKTDTSNSDFMKKTSMNNRIRAVFMAAEDGDFYNHLGVSPDAIIRCASKIITEGEQCGASTITQQVVKITTKNASRSIDRKIDEAFTAMEIEKVFTKDEIMHIYLNITPYGSNIKGLRTASKFYFGIDDPSQLNLAQLVTLASIVNDPTKLSPTIGSNLEANRTALEARKQAVFDQLESKLDKINLQLVHNFALESIITKDEISAARKQVVSYVPTDFGTIKAGHFVNFVISELQKKNYFYGQRPFTIEEIQTGGYTFVTSLDLNLQAIAENYAWGAGNNYKKWNAYNAAVMTALPSTGEILTMAGSKSFNGASEGCDAYGANCKYNPEVNVLTSKQSPGSTNKPLAYYIAYTQGRLAPGSFLPDVPIDINGYKPKNWDGRFMGVNNTKAREMLRLSRNIPALIVMDMIGVNTYIETAKAFGYTTYEDASQYGHSLVLGGGDIYPIEHAQAYAVFANGGDFVEFNSIKRIYDKEGNLVYEAKPQRKNVADPAGVYLLNQTLNRLDAGAGSTVVWDGRDIASKTGTTENNRDSFVVSYSPDFVTIAWVGNNNNDPLNQNYGWPGFVVAPWVQGYMRDLNARVPEIARATPFPKPSNVYYGGGYCTRSKCLGIAKDWLISGREPDSRWGVMPSPGLQRFLNPYLRRK